MWGCRFANLPQISTDELRRWHTSAPGAAPTELSVMSKKVAGMDDGAFYAIRPALAKRPRAHERNRKETGKKPERNRKENG
jgi:hypothetical protein